MRWTPLEYAAYLQRRRAIADVIAAPTELHVAPPKPSGSSTDEAKLNRTERAYLAVLRSEQHRWLGVQCITLKLADDCRLTPDFAYRHRDDGQLVFVDVKGFQREDALIKMKVAARMMPWARFVIVKHKGGLPNGSWHTAIVKP